MSQAAIYLTGFRDCDIRGEAREEITPKLAYLLGRAIGSIAREKRAVIGGDFRLSTPALLDGVKLDCAGGFGSSVMVTGTFGFVAATRAIERYLTKCGILAGK